VRQRADDITCHRCFTVACALKWLPYHRCHLRLRCESGKSKRQTDIISLKAMDGGILNAGAWLTAGGCRCDAGVKTLATGRTASRRATLLQRATRTAIRLE
jgi:hypothetical protein